MKTKLLLALSMLFFSASAHATLAGKNVVLVHGFLSEDLGARASKEERLAAAPEYWASYWGPRAEATLVYPSSGRVQGRIKDEVRDQFLSYQASGLCADGCIFVTHSTGDLVLRDAFTRLNQWGIDPNRFKVSAVIDLAGAGGGKHRNSE